MKKLTAIMLVIIVIFSLSVPTFAAEKIVRPSISISKPNERLIKEGDDVRYTITLASAYNENIVFDPSLIKADFEYDSMQTICINPNTYDLIFKSVKSTTGIGRFLCLKGAGNQSGLLTYESPESPSFFIYNSSTTRKEVADFLMRFVSSGGNDYEALIATGLLMGYGDGDLHLEDTITGSHAYILNRRVELMNH